MTALETRYLQADRLETRDADDGAMRVTARLVPFGETARISGGREERFTPETRIDTRGDSIPFVLGHREGQLPEPWQVVGQLTGVETRDDGVYGEIVLSDTQPGRETHTLLRDGALREVSIGFVPGEYRTDPDGVIVRESVTLDHVAVVHRGAYRNAAAVAVREQEQTVQDNDTTADEAVETRADEQQTLEVHTDEDVARIEDRMRSLEALVAGIESGAATQQQRLPDLGVAMRAFILAKHGNDRQKQRDAEIELRALAKDTTTTSTGIVPDHYSQEIISIVDTNRPFVAGVDRDPIGEYGMNEVYPKVVTKPSVAKQSSEGAEVSSTQLDIDPVTVPLGTFAGANAVSIQLIERSNPAFVGAYYRELAGIYAQETEQELETLVVAETTGTSVLADWSASATASQDALIDAAVGIAKAVKRMPEKLWLAPDKWGELAKMRDTTGRPLLLTDGSRENAVGKLSLRVANGSILELDAIMVPNFATATRVLMGWSGAAATLEQEAGQLRATRVSTLEVELGVYGYFGAAIKYPLGFHEFTEA